MRLRLLCVALTLGGLLPSSARCEDWPTYRHDIGRSGVTGEKPAFPLRLAWRYTPAQPPSPAWPPPHFILLNRMDFDYAPQPVIAEGIVCFGSSTDDTVRALDLRTGREKWHFTTGGPVRIAPHLAGGKVYFGSDDGLAYCLDAATGKLVWKFRGAPQEEQLIGNNRMMSRWPIRTGVLVDDGVAYCVAGMWASEGIYAWALNANTGKVLWCNDTTGYAGVDYNTLLGPANASLMPHGVHDGDFGVYGLTPQGALAAGQEVLLVPNGYATPAGLDRKTGKLLYARPAAGAGGHAVTVDGDKFYVIYRHRGENTLPFSHELATGKRITFLRGQVPNLTTLPVEGRPGSFHERGKASVIIHQGKLHARNAYSLVLAGGALLQGLEGALAAVDLTTGKELWRAPIDGEAWELAVANGRVIAATTRGTIYCFEPTTDGAAPAPLLHTPAASGAPPAAPPHTAAVLAQLRKAGVDRGYALILGDADGGLTQQLATQTSLHLINVVRDEAVAQTLRERFLTSTALYGSRIHIQAVTRLDRFPFAQYFASTIIVAGATEGLAGKELYRVLRPCGGLLLLPGVEPTAARSLLRDTGAPAEEVKSSEEGSYLVRGQLPGTLDWNNDLPTDPQVKWPLRPIWFGGPTTAQVTDFKHGNVRPFAAYGRYFVLGENTLTAVDAYNGCLLWSRPIPKHSVDLRMTRDLLDYTELVWSRDLALDFSRSVRVNDKDVFLTLGKGCFRSDLGCIQLDARTGEQKKVFGPVNEPQQIVLQDPQTWPLPIDEKHAGKLTLARDATGLTLTLQTTDPVVTPLDEWDLFFDFRPPQTRYGLYERGTFQLRVTPALDDKTPAAWTPGTGPAHPRIEISGKRQAEGTSTTVRLSWEEIRKLTGKLPASFGFAATLNSHDGGAKERIRQRHLFGDIVADGINNGWANVTLEAAAKVGPPGGIVAGPFAAVPRERTVRGWPKDIDPAVAALPRLHPLTGEVGPRIFRSGTGTCGGYDFSATSVIKRSGAAKLLGIYDFADDSGLRGFVGVSANCGASTTTALGLAIVSESKSRCVCNYPFRTTVVLAPAERRFHEDWAIFYDRNVDTLVRQAAINLGAFGDRRDEAGTLWLGFPRPLNADEAFGYPKAPGKTEEAILPGVWPLPSSASIQVPLAVETFAGFGPYRFNADRIPIHGTDRPWLYASGYRGIKQAVLQVNLFKPLASRAQQKPPRLDGVLAEQEWTGDPQVILPATKTSVWLTHDAKHLYLAARRTAVPDRLGKTWTKTTLGEDAEVYKDDSWEVFLSDTTSGRVVHLGVSASGARFDALLERDARSEDVKWNGKWASAVAADDQAFVVEMAIPWEMLTAAGLSKERLALNLQMNRTRTTGEALTYLGPGGRGRCQNFTPLGLGSPPPVPARRFQVRLHFAEPDDIAPGQRLFDVKVQGQIVLKDFDVVKAARGTRTALVKEFAHVEASRALVVEFVPCGDGALTPTTAPILSGIEVHDEAFRPLPLRSADPPPSKERP